MSPATTTSPPLRILIIDDEANIRTTLGMCLQAEGHTVVAHGNIHDALQDVARRVFDLVFLDVRLGMDNGLEFLPALRAESPWAQVIVITAFASIETAVEAMKKGAIDYLPKPFDAPQVQILTRKVAQRRQLEIKLQSMEMAMTGLDIETDLPTSSVIMRDSLELARQVAPSKVPILIRGEVGVGKGRLARNIHAWSKRAEAPFASISCALPGELLETELFGVTPGSVSSPELPGRAAFCDGGTLLLEEVGQTPAHLQSKILRLIRDREYERVDETQTRTSDVRIVATTSIDLQQAARAGVFRADLLMSLDVVEIALPSLRERLEDLPMLADRYLALLRKQNHARATQISSDAIYAMNKYDWPGNLRELRNVIERALLLCRGETIGIEHLPPNLLNPEPTYAVGDLVPLETIEKTHVLRVVAATRSLRRAASILGVDSSTLCRWMKRYGVRDDQPAA